MYRQSSILIEHYTILKLCKYISYNIKVPDILELDFFPCLILPAFFLNGLLINLHQCYPNDGTLKVKYGPPSAK